jgi:hypothetical protein
MRGYLLGRRVRGPAPGQRRTGRRRIAQALHTTVCALRNTHPATPSLCTSQVHAGPRVPLVLERFRQSSRQSRDQGGLGGHGVGVDALTLGVAPSPTAPRPHAIGGSFTMPYTTVAVTAVRASAG